VHRGVRGSGDPTERPKTFNAVGIPDTEIRTEVADAADATVAWSLLDRYEPEVLILVAGAETRRLPRRLLAWARSGIVGVVKAARRQSLSLQFPV
jgi:hypothetical protein